MILSLLVAVLLHFPTTRVQPTVWVCFPGKTPLSAAPSNCERVLDFRMLRFRLTL